MRPVYCESIPKIDIWHKFPFSMNVDALHGMRYIYYNIYWRHRCRHFPLGGPHILFHISDNIHHCRMGGFNAIFFKSFRMLIINNNPHRAINTTRHLPSSSQHANHQWFFFSLIIINKRIELTEEIRTCVCVCKWNEVSFKVCATLPVAVHKYKFIDY